MKHALLLPIATVAALSALAHAESAGNKPDLAKAQTIVNQVCSACHGADGNSATPANPSLAAQPAEYINLQLTHFKNGVRSNPVMLGMTANLSPDDMRALGAYFSQQKSKGQAAKDPDLVQTGRKIFRGGDAATGLPACSACHAPDGVGIPGRYPRLSGQYADYTYAQLKAFRAGERGMDKEGKDINGRVMAQIASKMSDRDMRAVAEYAAGLH